MDVESEAEELYFIAPNHEIDILEPLRQEIIVSLPMRLLCDDACSLGSRWKLTNRLPASTRDFRRLPICYLTIWNLSKQARTVGRRASPWAHCQSNALVGTDEATDAATTI